MLRHNKDWFIALSVVKVTFVLELGPILVYYFGSTGSTLTNEIVKVLLNITMVDMYDGKFNQSKSNQRKYVAYCSHCYVSIHPK